MNPDQPPPEQPEASAHSPLPWRKHDMEPDAIVGPDGKAIALVYGRSQSPEQNLENIDLIVRSVNGYAELERQLAAVRCELESAEATMREYIAHTNKRVEENARLHAELASAREALEKLRAFALESDPDNDAWADMVYRITNAAMLSSATGKAEKP